MCWVARLGYHRKLDDLQTRNIVTFIPEVTGSSDTFPMFSNNVEAKVVRPTPIVLLNIKEYFPCNERERQTHSI